MTVTSEELDKGADSELGEGLTRPEDEEAEGAEAAGEEEGGEEKAGEEKRTGAEEGKGGEVGAESDPVLDAIEALAEKNPDYAKLLMDEYEKRMAGGTEAVATAKETAAKEPAAKAAVFELADEQSTAEDTINFENVKETVAEQRESHLEIYKNLRDEYDEICAAITQMKEEKSNEGPTWNFVVNQQRKMYNELQRVKQSSDQAQQDLRLMKRVETVATHYKPLAGHKVLLARLIAEGRVGADAPLSRQAQAVNQALLAMGKAPMGAKPGMDKTAAQERLAKLKKLSLGKIGGKSGRQSAAPKTELSERAKANVARI